MNRLAQSLVEQMDTRLHGLSEFPTTRGYLVDTFESAQDTYARYVRYFNPTLLAGQRYTP